MNQNRFLFPIGILTLVILLAGCTTDESNIDDPKRQCNNNDDCMYHCPLGCINKQFDTPFDPDGPVCNVPPGPCICIKGICNYGKY